MRPVYLPRHPNILRTDGAASTVAFATHTTAMDITGDLDIRWFGTPDDSTPAANDALVAVWNDFFVDQRAYLLRLSTTGRLVLFHSVDGIVGLNTVSTNPIPSGRIGLRATLDADNGAGQFLKDFYYSQDDGHSWEGLGTPGPVAGTTSIFVSNAFLEVAARSNGSTDNYAGLTERIELRDNLDDGDPVVMVDFTTVARGATTFGPWTLQGGAEFEANANPDCYARAV